MAVDDFDPDAYLSGDNSAAPEAPAFDPDAYIRDFNPDAYLNATPDNPDIGRPAPETALGTGVRSAARATIPAGAGLVGAGLGGAAAGALGAGPVGAVVGGVAGMVAASMGAGYVQDKALEAAGFDDADQRAANAEAHPVADFVGGLAPAVATMSPSVAGGKVAQVLTRGVGGAMMGGFEAGQEYLNEGHVDPLKTAAAAAFGAVAPSVNKVGAKFVGAGERLVPGRPNRTANPAADQAHADVSDPTAEVEVGNSSLAQGPVSPATGETTGNPQSAPARSSRVYSKGVDPAEQARYAEAASDPEAMRQFAFEEGITEAEAREIVQANYQGDTATRGQIAPDTAAALAAADPQPIPAKTPPAEAAAASEAPRPAPAPEAAPEAQRAPEPAPEAPKVVEAGFPEPGEPVAVGANDATPMPERGAAFVKKAREIEAAKKLPQGEREAPEIKGETPINDSVTPAQREAGNYPKARTHDFGRPQAFETHAGDMRRGVSPTGEKWEVKLPYDYGYFNKTKGADKDHIDFARPTKDDPAYGNKHYVIDQKNAETGKFDEHKVFTYYADEAAARQHYREGFSDGKGDQRLGAITEVSRGDLVKFLAKHQNTPATKPYSKEFNGDTSAPKKDVRERAVFKDLVAKKPEMAEALAGASDEQIAKAIEGKRVRKYGVGTGASAGYPVEGVFTSDGQPVTANTKAKAAERSAAHKAVVDWFNKTAPKDLEGESKDALMKRLLSNPPNIEGWKPSHKPKEWMLAREAQRFLQKPTPAAEKKFRDAERMLRGADEDVEVYRGGNRTEADIARSRRGGDEAVANAEAKNVDMGRNLAEETALDKIDNARAAETTAAEEAGKRLSKQAVDDWKTHGGLEESVAHYRDVLFDEMEAAKLPARLQKLATDAFEADVKTAFDARNKGAKFDVPHEEAEEMVKPTPVKTRADLKELPRRTVDVNDSSLAKIDTKAISAAELRKAEAAKLVGKKSTKAAGIESEGAAAPVKRIQVNDPVEMAKYVEMLNKASAKKPGLDALPAEREPQSRQFKDLFDQFISDERGSGPDMSKVQEQLNRWMNSAYTSFTKRTEPKSYRAKTLKTPQDEYVQSLSDQLHTVKKQDENFFIRNLQALEAMPGELRAPENMRKIYEARDKDSAHFPLPAGQSGTHIDNLPPKLKALYDEHLKPMFDQNDEFVKAIRAVDPDRVGPDVQNHIQRIAKGDTSEYNMLKTSDDPTQPTYNGLSVSAGAAKNRKFYALVGSGGDRHVIQPTDNGFIKWKGYKPEKIKDSTFEFEDGGIYKAGPNSYIMRQATTKEIMDNARGLDGGKKPMRYYDNAGFSAAVSNAQLGAMMRHLTELHRITETPEFKKMSTRKDKTAKEKGWEESVLPNMKGTFLHPELKAVFDDFAGKPQTWYQQLNSNITKLLFWMPTAHLNNVGAHWLVGRGWDNFSVPKNYRMVVEDAPQAIKSVVNQDKFQMQMRDNGVGTIYGSVVTRRLMEQFAKKLNIDMEREPGKWGPVADTLGVPLKALGRAVYDNSAKVMWAGNDVFITQRVMELMRKHGFTKFDGSVDTPEYHKAMKQAIIEAERDIPNYRIPHIIGTNDAKGRSFSQFMQNPALTAFGRYHYGMYNSYANIIKDAVGKHAELGDRVDAAGKLLATAVLAFSIYPILDQLAKFITGNEGGKAARRGPVTVPSHLAEAAEGKQDIAAFARGSLTLPPLISAFIGALSNKDFRGKSIVEPGDLRAAAHGDARAAGKAVVQGGEYVARSLISPLNTFASSFQKAEKGANPALTAAKAVRDQALDIKDPSKKAVKYERMVPIKTLRDSRSRERQGGSGPIEGLYNKLTK